MARVYLSGPMRGLPELNFPAFFKAEEMAWALGWDVINPARMDKQQPIEGLSPEATNRAYARRDSQALLDMCAENGDAIAMLPGWTASIGARAEHSLAVWVGLKVLDATTFTPIEYFVTQPAPPAQPEPDQPAAQPAGQLDLKPTNPKDRVAISKLDLSLFPDTALAYGALAMVEGDAKYGGYNWRVGGVLASVYVAACRRHLSKWWNGEWSDPTTDVPHLGSALACIAILIDAYEAGVLKDDRPPVADVNMEELLVEFEKTVKHLHTLYPDGPTRYTEVEHGK